jgi:hypothetical protein
LYDLVECPQRVALDAFGDATSRDEINAFVRLLWGRGSLFEKETIANLRLPFVDLSDAADVDRERLTLDAMARGSPLIYGGRKEPGGYVSKPPSGHASSQGDNLRDCPVSDGPLTTGRAARFGRQCVGRCCRLGHIAEYVVDICRNDRQSQTVPSNGLSA